MSFAFTKNVKYFDLRVENNSVCILPLFDGVLVHAFHQFFIHSCVVGTDLNHLGEVIQMCNHNI